MGAAIEYGVGHLGIDDIVVCGHTHCGGIKALLEPIPPDREAHLGRWVEFTRAAHQLIAAARVPEADRLVATIKAHVQFQLDNLMTYDIVRAGVAAGRLNIHGWLYDMEIRDTSAPTIQATAAGADFWRSSEPKPRLARNGERGRYQVERPSIAISPWQARISYL